MDPPGIEPGFSVCQTGVLPLDDEPVVLSVDRRGIEPHRFPRITGRLAEPASSRWTSSPGCRVDLMGVEPIAPTVQRSVASWDVQARVVSVVREVRPGIEPGLPPYHGGVLPKHLQTNQ